MRSYTLNGPQRYFSNPVLIDCSGRRGANHISRMEFVVIHPGAFGSQILFCLDFQRKHRPYRRKSVFLTHFFRRKNVVLIRFFVGTGRIPISCRLTGLHIGTCLTCILSAVSGRQSMKEHGNQAYSAASQSKSRQTAAFVLQLIFICSCIDSFRSSFQKIVTLGIKHIKEHTLFHTDSSMRQSRRHDN